MLYLLLLRACFGSGQTLTACFRLRSTFLKGVGESAGSVSGMVCSTSHDTTCLYLYNTTTVRKAILHYESHSMRRT